MKVTYLIPLFFVVLFFVPTNIFAQDDNVIEEPSDNSKQDLEPTSDPPFFIFQFNIINVILAVIITLTVPIIYYAFQKWRRNEAIKKIWHKKRIEADNIEISASNFSTADLQNILHDLEKLETLVSITLNAEDFIIYAREIRIISELINSPTPRTQVSRTLKDWLVKLDSS